MNPISFLFRMLASSLAFTADEAEGLMHQTNEWWDGVDKTKGVWKILSNPLVIMALGIIAPFLINFIMQKLESFAGDRDNDGDVDPVDVLAALVEKMRNQKQA